MTVLQLTCKLILFIAVGFAARRLRVMADGFDKMLSKFLMAIPLPCMIVNSFHIEYSVEYLMDAPILLGLSVGSMACLGKNFAVMNLFCWLVCRKKRKATRYAGGLYTRAATRTRISSLGGTYFIPLNYPGKTFVCRI